MATLRENNGPALKPNLKSAQERMQAILECVQGEYKAKLFDDSQLENIARMLGTNDIKAFLRRGNEPNNDNSRILSKLSSKELECTLDVFGNKNTRHLVIQHPKILLDLRDIANHHDEIYGRILGKLQKNEDGICDLIAQCIGHEICLPPSPPGEGFVMLASKTVPELKNFLFVLGQKDVRGQKAPIAEFAEEYVSTMLGDDLVKPHIFGKTLKILQDENSLEFIEGNSSILKILVKLEDTSEQPILGVVLELLKNNKARVPIMYCDDKKELSNMINTPRFWQFLVDYTERYSLYKGSTDDIIKNKASALQNEIFTTARVSCIQEEAKSIEETQENTISPERPRFANENITPQSWKAKIHYPTECIPSPYLGRG